jgi:2-phosphosulfolactate phosphatase
VEIRRMGLDTSHDARGVVVVVDVIRAFTTTAFAFDRGATEVLLVSTVEEAFALRERHRDCLLVGEVDRFPIPGFDYSNSPTSMSEADLRGRRLIMRTSAGTQGVVMADSAERVFAASLCVAASTARSIKALDPRLVTFVETGTDAGGRAEEDVACADYVAALLRGTPTQVESIAQRVRASSAAARFTSGHPDLPASDLEHALMIDRFDFAMEVERRGGLAILRRVEAGRAAVGERA